MRFLLLSFLVFSFSGLFSQNGWDWGKDKLPAMQKYKYVQTYMNSKHYTECRPTVNWLLVNTPNLNSELYNRAAVVYKESEKIATDPLKKIALQDSVLWIYDTWIQKFGSDETTPAILNSKGKVYYKYYIKRDSVNLADLQSFYKNLLQINKGATSNKNVKYYMSIVLKRKQAKKITDNELLDAYTLAIKTLTLRREAYKGDQTELDRVNRTEKKVINSLVKYVSLDCQSIVMYFQPLFVESPTDNELQTSIQLLLNKNNCKKEPLYLEVVKAITVSKPTSEQYIKIAEMELNNSNSDSAVHYYNKALKIVSTRKEQGEIYYKLAKIANQKRDRTGARNYARKTIATGFYLKEAHTLIGDLYYNSGTVCKSDNELIDRSIYIAAYLQYEKAGDQTKMSAAKTQFPSMEDIFVQSKKEGDIINTGCWINEDVPLKKR
jgi:tetratricopeptide (TPR) repeat protein